MTIYSATLLKPELFHTFPHQMLSSESQERKKQRYESSNLQEEQKDKYIKKLNTYMQRNKPYLKPDLTLSQLAEEVKIPTHYLSQVINEKLDCNFIDFINNYRVEEVKSKLVNPKLSHYTIISIAYEAGFSAKSTFNAVFKKVEGITPSQYRKNNRP
jgi:AraC-like DNA-binding protein